jgi:hypothetical protein
MLGDWSGNNLSQTTEHVILLDQSRGLIDHSSRRAQGFIDCTLCHACGLLRPLSDHGSRSGFFGYM